MSDTGANDHDVAARIAAGAGQELLRVREESSHTGRALGDEGDARAQDFIAQQLLLARPNDAVLSEEAKDDAARVGASRVWIVDPLDGTREYSEGRADWAVHVALWESGSLAAGAIAIPGEGLVLSTGQTSGADQGRPDSGTAPVRIAVSRTRPPQVLERLAQLIDIELVPMGSAGVKIAAVARGHVDAYVHAGGQYEWDSAAPVAVAQSRGYVATRIDGSPLEYNRADPYLPDLVVCHPAIANVLMGAIATALEEASAND